MKVHFMCRVSQLAFRLIIRDARRPMCAQNTFNEFYSFMNFILI